MKSIFLTFMVIVVSSCTTLSKEDCQTMNWHERGKSDALKGKTSRAFAGYLKACSKHGMTIDQESYSRGREEGLRIFCSYDNGQQFGRDGETYEAVCPQNLEADFLKGYRIGKKEHDLEQKKKELERREQELERQEEKLRSRQAVLSSLNKKQCTFNSDCTIDDDCSFGQCKRSGAKCSFNSDCEIEGRCSLETVCAGSDCDQANICKYH